VTALSALRRRVAMAARSMPSATAPHVLTSEQAIRECQALVDEMKAGGWVPPDDGEPLTADEEAALIERAMREVNETPTETAEDGSGCRSRYAVAERR
jgi:hypothetical protein